MRLWCTTIHIRITTGRRGRRKVVFWVFAGVMAALVVCVGVFIVMSLPEGEEDMDTPLYAAKEPTVAIIDENGNGEVSGRIREFVG